YNNVRGMLGYTGTYKGKRVSVQGTGMGVPSISIYVNELIQEYDVKKLIRVGTCGGMKTDVNISDIILAQGATHDSQTNTMIFGHECITGEDGKKLFPGWKCCWIETQVYNWENFHCSRANSGFPNQQNNFWQYRIRSFS